MPSASRFGATSPPNPIPLYVCSAIVDDAEAAAQHFDPMTNQRRDYYIGLFHEIRWHASKKTSRKSKVPEWMALCQSWNAFVENFNKDAKAYRARITAAHLRCETCSRRHMIDRLHNEAMEAGIPCTVPFGTACSHCPLGLSVSPSEMSPGTRLCVYLFSCVISAFNLERRDERRDSPSVSGDRSARAGVTATLRSGLRTPSPFPERPPSERSEVLMYLAHDSLDYPPSRAARIAQWWRRERKDNPPALDQFQSEEFAQLQQELRYQKAQVAQAAQTASNIQVELGSHIVRLHDLVVAPEKLAYADSSFSASHQD
ncbi:hypothetical protein PC112_g23990 [Phytophthora cactorum]|nr:hypothetical protein PC112_g23990 [Phytophthora cactorum]KAG3122667.1 hypothetical protein C6341_g26871 [Phytophthora cactorum]